MARYLVCGAILESPIPLPELPVALDIGRPADLTLHLACVRIPRPSPYREWPAPDGSVWLSFAKHDSRYFLDFPGLAEFELSEGAPRIHYSCPSATPPETLRHLLMDVVIPLGLAAQGNIVLHASAVKGSQGAILFLGSSGDGKSTLAASFTREGGVLLGDDAIRIRDDGSEVVALPSYPSLRLWEDMASDLFGSEESFPDVAHYTKKKRIALSSPPSDSAGRGVRISKAFVLAPPAPEGDNGIRIDALSQREACVEILRHSYCLDPSDGIAARAGLDRAAGVAAKVPFFRLTYPRKFEQLPEIRRILLETEDSRHAWSR